MCSECICKLGVSVDLSASLSIALPTGGCWQIQMNLLFVPERPYYLCLLPCYYTSFAMLDNHYSSHREREASMPVSTHTNTQEAAALHAVWRAQALGGAAHRRPF